MTLVAIEGTTRDKLNDAIRFCEQSRVAAERRVIWARGVARAQLEARHRFNEMQQPSDANVAALARALLKDDVQFNDAISAERWGHQLVQTYAQLELLKQQTVTQRLLTQLTAKLDELALVDVASEPATVLLQLGNANINP